MKNLIKYIAMILLALALVFIDVYCFSFLSIGGVSILSSFLVILIFALFIRRDFIILSLALIIFLSIFSSLETWISIVFYLALPSLIVYLRKAFLPEPSIFVSSFYFVASLTVFGLFLFLDFKEFSPKSFEIILHFVLINTIVGVALFAFFQNLFQKSSNKIKF